VATKKPSSDCGSIQALQQLPQQRRRQAEMFDPQSRTASQTGVWSNWELIAYL